MCQDAFKKALLLLLPDLVQRELPSVTASVFVCSFTFSVLTPPSQTKNAPQPLSLMASACLGRTGREAGKEDRTERKVKKPQGFLMGAYTPNQFNKFIKQSVCSSQIQPWGTTKHIF